LWLHPINLDVADSLLFFFPSALTVGPSFDTFIVRPFHATPPSGRGKNTPWLSPRLLQAPHTT
jgi:hypothetical protein